MAVYRFDTAPIVCSATGKLKTTGERECLLHAGESFSAYYRASLAAGASATLLIITPDTDKLIEMDFGATGTLTGELTVHEDPTATKAASNTVEMSCNNRREATTPVLDVTHTPTGVDTSGSLVVENILFGSQGGGPAPGSGGDGISPRTLLLAQNQTYLATLTNRDASDTGIFEIELHWGEKDPIEDTFYSLPVD